MDNNIPEDDKQKDSFKRACEFWRGRNIVEVSEGGFTAKDGTPIGVRTITWSAQPKTEDADFEIIPPKEIENGTT